METTERSIQKVISKKALKMGSSFPCQLCVVGFFFGICLTYFFMASLTSFGGLELSTLGFSIPMARNSSYTSTSDTIYMDARANRSFTPVQLESRRASQDKEEWQREGVTVLDSVWGALLNESADEVDQLLSRLGMTRSSVPRAPHSENCEKIMEVNKQFDTWGENGTFPPWTSWKGLLKQHKHIGHHDEPEAYQPPWIVGSDGDNFPLTRRVQKDIWIHQHPSNCSDPHVRFLIADWETLPGFGIGAQVTGMCGLLAIAMNEHRILVTKYYNRADHAGCRGEFRSHWSCYFFLETSRECQHRAFDLMIRKEAWENGIVTGKDNYTSKEIWAGRIPRIWGNPWDYLQPTTEINGTLITHHRKMDRRWWRAQAVRYLMRFHSKYTCHLMNIARHKAFGLQAATMVLENLKGEWPKGPGEESESDIEEIVWSKHKPWTPRPLISMHVRMGDKACEMKVVEFKTYMHLADRIRKRFPNIHSIWLSTEMQEVIDELKSYPNWNFYYTNISRQLGNTSMAAYEARLGREISTNYPLVNFLMATEADFFIGALGSTWCFLIDGMRNTGGKVMAGYLSVNKDRFW